MNISKENLKKGIRNPKKAVRHIYDRGLIEQVRRASASVNSRKQIGTNVFERNWDLLIILDTCRVDALRHVAPEYSFINGVSQIRSVGGGTPEWIAATFDRKYEDEIAETGYLCANVWAEGILEHRGNFPSVPLGNKFHDFTDWNYTAPEKLGRMEYVSKYEDETRLSEEFLGHPQGASSANLMTDRAIDVGRSNNLDRLIVHYIQPHYPYVATAKAEDRKLYEHEKYPSKYLIDKGDFETVYQTYLDELRSVLNEVEILLSNVNKNRTVITADHGEAFGEYGLYGHEIGSLHPHVRTVPWVTTSAVDHNTYDPKLTPQTWKDQSSADSVKSRLSDLGYVQ